MSREVFTEAWRPGNSLSRATDRVVLGVLADAASPVGVCWWGQARIAAEANCDVREVRRATEELERLGDIEVRWAQRGRTRIKVYRVVVGRIGDRELDHSQLPFTVDRPFSRPDELSARREALAASPHEATTGSEPTADDRTNRPPVEKLTTGHFRRDGRTSRARVKSPLFNQEQNQQQQQQAARNPDAAAARDLDKALKEVGVGTPLRLRALADPDRARAWLNVAVREADTNPAGFFRVGFETGDWPSQRIKVNAPQQTRHRWIEETSWRLDPEDAHTIVDGWKDLDDVERSRLHELADETRARREQQLEPARKAGAA